MKILRETLYQRVWSTPMTKLAREFDISDVGLSKVCRKNGIPTPPPGFWAKAVHGKAPARPPLPPSQTEHVVFDAPRHRVPVPANLKLLARTEAPVVRLLPIASEDDEEGMAAVSSATYDVLRNAKPDKDGFVRSRSSNVFTCAVSSSSVARAAQILDAIERGLTASGVAVQRDRESKQVFLVFEQEKVGLTLAEVYNRKDEVKVDPRYEWMKTHVYTYTFTGELKLLLEGDYAGRKVWSDGSRFRLESKLGDFIDGVKAAAWGIRAVREEREARQRYWAEQARLREVAAEHERRLKQFRDNFAAEAAAWSRHREAVAYLAFLTEKSSVGMESLPEDGKAWLVFAEHVVSTMDIGRRRVQRLREGHPLPDLLPPFETTFTY